MKKIHLVFMLLTFCGMYAQQGTDSEVYALLSYGLGDNPINAKKGYVCLVPDNSGHNCYVPNFSIDSLYSSIFNL